MTVPSWAASMLSNYRASCAVSENVTDKELWDFLETLSGMENDDKVDAVREEFTGR